MSNSLEQFIRDHRDEFDSEEPSKKVWESVQNHEKPAEAPVTRVVHFQFVKWAAAAILLVVAGAGTTWLIMRNHSSTRQVATVQKPAQDSPAQSSVKVPANLPPVQSSETVQQTNTPKNEQAVDEKESNYKEEMFHYARLVEIKHQELKKIEKDEPLLYKQFAADVNKLDSVYHTLENQLPKNPNREQLLEAMRQNLQLQMDLLNHQLEIIKQINHSKKSAYENAYKTI